MDIIKKTEDEELLDTDSIKEEHLSASVNKRLLMKKTAAPITTISATPLQSPPPSPAHSSFKKPLLQKEGSFEKLKKTYGINVEDIAIISGADANEIKLYKALKAMENDEDIEDDISKIG